MDGREGGGVKHTQNSREGNFLARNQRESLVIDPRSDERNIHVDRLKRPPTQMSRLDLDVYSQPGTQGV